MAPIHLACGLRTLLIVLPIKNTMIHRNRFHMFETSLLFCILGGGSKETRLEENELL